MKRTLFATTVLALVLTTAFAIANTGEARNLNSAQEPSAQGQRRQSEVRDLTIQLANLNSRYQLGSKAERDSLLAELSSIAATRREMLASLIEDDPAEVLRVAVPDDIRASMPAQLQSYIEERVNIEGELEVVYQEDETESQLLYSLNLGKERLSLHFVTRPNRDLLTNTRVRVKGVRLGNEMALEGGSNDGSVTASTDATSLQTLSVVPNTFGEQKVLVLLVNFQDKTTQPWTANQVRDVVFNQVNNFYKESSYQQTWLTGDVFGWYTLPISSTTCDQNVIATYAKQAATAAGVNLAAYNRYVYAYPSISCGWIGWGTYGGNPSQAWINGVFTLKNVGHELGHNFGLYHARYLDCGANVIGSNCTVGEYGDSLDIMGNTGVTAHSHAAQKERLGWLNYGISPAITTVQANGTYWIDPYETSGSNSKALKILKSTDPTTGVKTWYYVEFRRPVGYDSFISSNSNFMNGVVVHTGTEGYSFDEYLLDMTPSTTSFGDAALVVGLSYNDPNINMTMTPNSVSSSGASVNISFGPQPCVRANPTLTLSPSASQWVSAGSTVTYQVSVTNNDSSGCTSSSFDLQSAVPSGWSGVFGSSTLTISPGANANTTFPVTSSSLTSDGYYSIGVTATNSSASSYSAAASVTCSIMSGLTVSVASDKASYSAGQSATITANVTAAGSPISGVSISFVITKPDGTKAATTATTAANGSATCKYRFNKQKDPIGAYQVSAGANLNGVLGSGVTSFSLK